IAAVAVGRLRADILKKRWIKQEQRLIKQEQPENASNFWSFGCLASLPIPLFFRGRVFLFGREHAKRRAQFLSSPSSLAVEWEYRSGLTPGAGAPVGR
ncbi:MAG: hypothetical protein RBT36_11285, partial [Desulfobulbus sp.]|nr:hypothetical protein [Desulfobulbus sp.]